MILPRKNHFRITSKIKKALLFLENGLVVRSNYVRSYVDHNLFHFSNSVYPLALQQLAQVVKLLHSLEEIENKEETCLPAVDAQMHTSPGQPVTS